MRILVHLVLNWKFSEIISRFCALSAIGYTIFSANQISANAGQLKNATFSCSFHLSCSVLQCVAVCCSVLQCVAVCFGSVAWPNQCQLQHTLQLAVCCSVLQCVAVCCSVLQCVAVCCSQINANCNIHCNFQCHLKVATLALIWWQGTLKLLLLAPTASWSCRFKLLFLAPTRLLVVT